MKLSVQEFETDSSESPVANLTSSFVTVVVLILVFCFLIIACHLNTETNYCRCPSILNQTLHYIVFVLSSLLPTLFRFILLLFWQSTFAINKILLLFTPIKLQRQHCNNNSCTNYFSRHFATYESTSISLVRYIAHNGIVKRQRLARKVARFHSHQKIERPVTSSHCTQWI